MRFNWRLLVVTVLCAFVAYFVASALWYEFGPEGQKRDDVNACIEYGTDRVMSDPELDGDTIGVALDNIIEGCNEQYQ